MWFFVSFYLLRELCLTSWCDVRLVDGEHQSLALTLLRTRTHPKVEKASQSHCNTLFSQPKPYPTWASEPFILFQVWDYT